MAAIRNGTRVCLIMSMQTKGIVLEVFEKEHKTMLTAGPLSKSWWARIQLEKSALGAQSIIECRLGDLMVDE